jgi:hypothetical protein
LAAPLIRQQTNSPKNFLLKIASSFSGFLSIHSPLFPASILLPSHLAQHVCLWICFLKAPTDVVPAGNWTRDLQITRRDFYHHTIPRDKFSVVFYIILFIRYILTISDEWNMMKWNETDLFSVMFTVKPQKSAPRESWLSEEFGSGRSGIQTWVITFFHSITIFSQLHLSSFYLRIWTTRTTRQASHVIPHLIEELFLSDSSFEATANLIAIRRQMLSTE